MSKKEYSLTLKQDEISRIKEAVDTLHGYFISKITRNMGPHGEPYDEETTMFMWVEPQIKLLANHLSFRHQEIIKSNENQKELADQLAKSIADSIVNRKEDTDLLTCIVKTVQKYQIIGKEKEIIDDQALPF